MSLKIINKSDDLYDKLMCGSISGRKHDCRFKSPSKERYCLATSHTSCGKCRFFKPTSQAKLKLFTEKINYLSGMMSKLLDENKRLYETISIERTNNKHLKEENEFLEKKTERLERLARKRRE